MDVTVEIAAPPEAVAAVLLDADLAPQWTSDLELLKVVSGTPGEAGCVALAYYREGSRSYVLEDVLIEAVPNCRYRSRVSGSGMLIEVQTDLEPTGTGTLLRLQWEGSSRNPLLRLALPMVRRRIERRAAADLASLRDLVEARLG